LPSATSFIRKTLYEILMAYNFLKVEASIKKDLKNLEERSKLK